MLLLSTTCAITVDSCNSSSVALNAASNCDGSFCMNPTVSVMRIVGPEGKFTRLVSGSKVENSLFSESVGVFVILVNNALLPALV